MSERLLLPMLGATLVACGGVSSPAVDLADIEPNLESWDGKTAIVEGWLVHCDSGTCLMIATKEGLDLIYHGCPGDRCEDALALGGDLVSIGTGDEKFETNAKALAGQHVRLTARINAASWKGSCLDRCDALQPISISPYPN